MKIKQMPFRFGDVIWVNQGIFKGKNIVNDCAWNGNSWEYSTNHGAWINHEDCTLLREANLKSINMLYEELDDE